MLNIDMAWDMHRRSGDLGAAAIETRRGCARRASMERTFPNRSRYRECPGAVERPFVARPEERDREMARLALDRQTEGVAPRTVGRAPRQDTLQKPVSPLRRGFITEGLRYGLLSGSLRQGVRMHTRCLYACPELTR